MKIRRIIMGFDGKKLIQTIILNEEKTGELYTSLAEKMTDKKAKNLFTKLASDEFKHKDIYTKLLENLPGEGIVELDEDELKYTESLIENNIFDASGIKKRFVKEDAMILAEKIERDAILFVGQLKTLYPELAKDELAIITREEKKHLQFVLDKKFNATVGLIGL
jgi:rubrerythrin